MYKSNFDKRPRNLFLPLIRLLVGLSIGLLVANLLETLQWTATLARFAKPLARLAHFHPVSGAGKERPRYQA